MSNQNNDRIYFFHESLFHEILENWLKKREINQSAKNFIKLIIESERQKFKVMLCDKTKDGLTKKKEYEFSKDISSLINLIEEVYLPDGNNEENINDYSLRVASFYKMNLLSRNFYFVVSDDKKEEIERLAKQKGYSLNVISILALV